MEFVVWIKVDGGAYFSGGPGARVLSVCNDGPVVAGFGLESRAVEVAGFGHDVKAEVDFVVFDGDDFCAAVRVDGDAVACGDVLQALDVDAVADAAFSAQGGNGVGFFCPVRLSPFPGFFYAF